MENTTRMAYEVMVRKHLQGLGKQAELGKVFLTFVTRYDARNMWAKYLDGNSFAPVYFTPHQSVTKTIRYINSFYHLFISK